VAITTAVAATGAGCVAAGAGFTAIGFAVFHYSFVEGDDTEAGLAGAFHLGDGGHGDFLLGKLTVFILTSEWLFKYCWKDFVTILNKRCHSSGEFSGKMVKF